MTTWYLKIFIEKSKNDQLRECIVEIQLAKDVSCDCKVNPKIEGKKLRYFSAADVNMMYSDFNLKPVV